MFKSIEVNPADDDIVLLEDMEYEYFDRLVDDLKQRDIYSTLHNKLLVHEPFREKLLRFLNNNADDLKDVFKQIDNNGLKLVSGEVHFWDESDIDDSSGEYRVEDITFPLIEAATEGYVDIVEFLIKMKCNVNHLDSFGRSALYRACEGGFHDVVEILLIHGADTSLCHEDESSPLHMACRAGKTSIVQLLLANNVDVCELDQDNISPLRISCEQGNIDIVRLLLQNEANVNMSDIWMKHCPLQMACDAGHLNVVKLLLENDADVNSVSEFNDTPLSLACEGSFADIVRVLLENKAEIFETIPSKSPLFIACQNENAGIVQMLLDSNNNVYPGIYEWDGRPHLPLAAACASNQVYIMQMLLQKCSDKISCFDMCFSMRTASFCGCTDIVNVFMKNADLLFSKKRISVINESMYLACKGGHIETVQYFLSQGIDVFQYSDAGRSLVHATCESSLENGGHKAVISLLIQNKLDISKPDNDGLSPLHLACQNCLLSVCEFLISNNANVNMQDYQSKSPLHFACQSDSLSLCEFLISIKANVNMQDYQNKSPLHFACERIEPNIDIIEVLLKNKASFELFDIAGKTPLHVICERFQNFRQDTKHFNMFLLEISSKYKSIVKSLISYGADVNARDNEGETPLHKTCRYGNNELVKTILSSNKSDLNLRNKEGQTPLYLACKFSHEQVIKILLERQADTTLEDKDGKSPLDVSLEMLKSLEEKCNYFKIFFRDEVDNLNDLNSKCNVLKHIVSLLTEFSAHISKS
ncbi:ankyrin repeat domain-containing protein 50-like [Mytilus edulis]|uniref:ankyrin repeat domain-containing protein 50-like n=1 Tax=Mytilus edulis TaxID=6550 RepID=UPI0039EF274A